MARTTLKSICIPPLCATDFEACAVESFDELGASLWVVDALMAIVAKLLMDVVNAAIFLVEDIVSVVVVASVCSGVETDSSLVIEAVNVGVGLLSALGGVRLIELSIPVARVTMGVSWIASVEEVDMVECCRIINVLIFGKSDASAVEEAKAV